MVSMNKDKIKEGEKMPVGNLPYKVEDLIQQAISQNNELIIEKINEFWYNEQLQDAITKFGEWNDKELEEVKKKVLNDLINNLKS